MTEDHEPEITEEVATDSKPDETQYDLMEIAAAAGGAEAEARRHEVAKWSDAQGQMADRAARRTVAAGEMAIPGGEASVQEAMTSASNDSAKVGELVDLANLQKKIARPTATGIELKFPSQTHDTDLRSPAQIAQEKAAREEANTPKPEQDAA